MLSFWCPTFLTEDDYGGFGKGRHYFDCAVNTCIHRICYWKYRSMIHHVRHQFLIHLFFLGVAGACYYDLNQSMYVFGGCTQSSCNAAFNDLWRLDLNSKEWIRPLASGENFTVETNKKQKFRLFLNM